MCTLGELTERKPAELTRERWTLGELAALDV